MLTRTSTGTNSSTRSAARTERATSVGTSVIRLSAGASGRCLSVATIARSPPWARSSASTSMGRSASRASAEWSRRRTRSRSTDGGPATGGFARAVKGVGEKAPRRRDARLEGGGALRAEEGVGVVAGREQRHAEAERAPALERARAADRPRDSAPRRLEQLLGALGRLATGRVGVEEQHRIVAVAPEERQLRRGKGGAERRDRLAEAVLVGHEAVHVTLHEQRAVLRLDRGARQVGGVEEVAFRVERRLGRVQVLGRLVAEGAPAEGDGAPLEVADREEEPAAETVVDAGAVLALDREARRHERLLADLLAPHEIDERVPPFGGQAEAEAHRDLGVDSPRREVESRALARRLPQVLGVEARGELHHAEELFAAAVDGRAAPILRERHARLLRERADGLGEGELVLAHEEAEHVAAHAAAEAVEDALLRIDHER